jgi:uncharacterized membrane protein YvlD (DUF360 family)
MKLLANILVALIGNTVGLLLIGRFVPHVFVSTDLGHFLVLVLSLTVLGLVVKPIFRIILGPVIMVTLGLGLVLVYAILLFILDFFSPSLSIQGVLPLFYSSVLLGATTFIAEALHSR